MSKIVDLGDYRAKEIIAIDEGDMISICNATIGTFIHIEKIGDSLDELLDPKSPYQAKIVKPENELTNAELIFNMLAERKYFKDLKSVYLTYMDILLEQHDLDSID